MNGEVLTGDSVSQVEFSFGSIQKVYPLEVNFDGVYFRVPLTQQDTFSFSTKKPLKYQARVLFNDGTVKSTTPVEFSVVESQSRGILPKGVSN